MDPVLIPTLKDNYTYLLPRAEDRTALVIDPGEAGPVLAWCRANGFRVTEIFCTHHHWDHIGGVPELKVVTGARVRCSAHDVARIAGADRGLGDGETLSWGPYQGRTIAVPGHTLGHMALYFAEAGWLFTGDTLFSLGCGRLFEGSAEQLFTSLTKLSRLPPETRIFCGHEYTLQNGRFAIFVDRDNLALQARLAQAEEARAAGRPTVPSTLNDELETNPFLRVDTAPIRRAVRASAATPAPEVFLQLRLLKDTFQG